MGNRDIFDTVIYWGTSQTRSNVQRHVPCVNIFWNGNLETVSGESTNVSAIAKRGEFLWNPMQDDKWLNLQCLEQ